MRAISDDATSSTPPRPASEPPALDALRQRLRARHRLRLAVVPVLLICAALGGDRVGAARTVAGPPRGIEATAPHQPSTDRGVDGGGSGRLGLARGERAVAFSTDEAPPVVVGDRVEALGITAGVDVASVRLVGGPGRVVAVDDRRITIAFDAATSTAVVAARAGGAVELVILAPR